MKDMDHQTTPDQDDANLPVEQRRISEMLEEYTLKVVGAEAEVGAYHHMVQHMQTISTVGGAFAHPTLGLEERLSVKLVEQRLLKSAWRAVYDMLPVKQIASAKDRKRIELLLETPPPFTRENIRDHLGFYLLDPRHHVLRGLAEAFSDLDPAFKSHDKMKIGVKGLPKRIVITGAFSSDTWGTWGYQEGTVTDVVNALQVYRGEPRLTHVQFDAMAKEAKAHGESDWPGGKIKRFRNGNAHLHFDTKGLLDINRGLAEFYGEVLADSPEAEAETPRRRPGTEVSADLAYFWSPADVVAELIDRAVIKPDAMILEPSCGDGRIMDGVRDYVLEHDIKGVRMVGIEYHGGRAEEARAKGHSVMQANFLQVADGPRFDVVVMNPPFAGRHYVKHTRKAIAMLKPGGMLVAVLPATAWYDHGELPGPQFDPARPRWTGDTWRDLPIASFREAGTNVCTGIWRYWKQRSGS